MQLATAIYSTVEVYPRDQAEQRIAEAIQSALDEPQAPSEIIKAADYYTDRLNRIAFKRQPVRDLADARAYYENERAKMRGHQSPNDACNCGLAPVDCAGTPRRHCAK